MSANGGAGRLRHACSATSLSPDHCSRYAWESRSYRFDMSAARPNQSMRRSNQHFMSAYTSRMEQSVGSNYTDIDRENAPFARGREVGGQVMMINRRAFS